MSRGRLFLTALLLLCIGLCPIHAAQAEFHTADEGFDSIWFFDGSNVSSISTNYIGSSTLNGDSDGDSDGDIDTPIGNAWALHADHGHVLGIPYFVSGLHLLSNSLNPGDSFSIDMDTGPMLFDQFNAEVGFNLSNPTGSGRGFEFYASSSSSSSNHYQFGNLLDVEDSGIPITDEGLRVTFTLLEGDRYNLSVELLESGQLFTFLDRPLGLDPGTSIARVGLYNSAAGSGPLNDVFYNNLQVVTGSPISDRFVVKDNPAASPPYTNWATAAADIQQAVDVALAGDTIWVSNGVYNAGGRAGYPVGSQQTNRLVIDKPVTVRSANGSDVTSIQGLQGDVIPYGPAAIRGVYMTNGASLIDFTIFGGATSYTNSADPNDQGGGIWCEGPGAMISNCILSGNAGHLGGGGYGGRFVDCLVESNRAILGGGGLANATAHNCTIARNVAVINGGGLYQSTASVCAIWENSALYGGGTYRGFIESSSLYSNSAAYGAGANFGLLEDCNIYDNLSSDTGGGTVDGTNRNCRLYRNLAVHGGGSAYAYIEHCDVFENGAALEAGGVLRGTAVRCRIFSNETATWGGGARYSSLIGCAVFDNTAGTDGGGASDGRVENCTVTGNRANYGGGIAWATNVNCIVFHNKSTNAGYENIQGGVTMYACTTPDPGGIGNITSDPQLVSISHIYSNSPCIGAGSSNETSTADIDGEPWSNPPSIGCDEPLAPFDGDLSVDLSASAICVLTGRQVNFTADIVGIVTSNTWSFDDSFQTNNIVFLSRSWTLPGEYSVTLSAYNADHPSGVSTSITIYVLSNPVHYVDAANLFPKIPYTNWADAANTIQDAVDAAAEDGQVWVADGTYDRGARRPFLRYLRCRVLVTKNLAIRSVNGPGQATIAGEGPIGSNAIRCVLMTAGSLSGFTLTNGHTRLFGYDEDERGAGFFATGESTISNCVISGNHAGLDGGGGSYGRAIRCLIVANTAGRGGGLYASKADHCLISHNHADDDGGGGFDLNAVNCTIVTNQADGQGDGLAQGSISNCIVYYNGIGGAFDNLQNVVTMRSCSPGLSDFGNILADPLFVDSTNSDFHLQPVSPCIDKGDPALLSPGVDLDGVPLPLDGDTNGVAIVDMGCYEFLHPLADSDGDFMRDGWEQLYGLRPNDPDDATDDEDEDGVNNVSEWIADTIPTDSNSQFRIISVNLSDDFEVFFTCTNSRLYSLAYAVNLATNEWTGVEDQTNVPGLGPEMSLSDTNLPSPPFFQVRVRIP